MNAIMEDNLNVIVRVMPGGEEHEVQVPRFTTGKEIVDALLDNHVAKRTDAEGNPYTFKLVSKLNNIQLSDDKTLDDVGIKDGDTLLFIPDMIAG